MENALAREDRDLGALVNDIRLLESRRLHFAPSTTNAPAIPRPKAPATV